GGFKRRFEPGDAALVDVGLLLFLRRLLDIDVVERLSVDDGHAQFFCLRRVDQHAFHVRSLRARPVMGRHAERRGVSPGDFVPGPRMRSHQPGFPALRHHGGPRERFLNVFRDRRPRRPAGGQGFGVARDMFSYRPLTNRAGSGADGPSLVTSMPRGQCCRADLSAGRWAFGPRATSCEIRTLPRVASVADQESRWPIQIPRPRPARRERLRAAAYAWCGSPTTVPASGWTTSCWASSRAHPSRW